MVLTYGMLFIPIPILGGKNLFIMAVAGIRGRLNRLPAAACGDMVGTYCTYMRYVTLCAYWQTKVALAQKEKTHLKKKNPIIIYSGETLERTTTGWGRIRIAYVCRTNGKWVVGLIRWIIWPHFAILNEERVIPTKEIDVDSKSWNKWYMSVLIVAKNFYILIILCWFTTIYAFIISFHD